VSVTLDQLNGLDRETFVEAVGWVFEHSPWVAEQAWQRRPFSDVAELHGVMTSVVAAADPDRQLALLRAHPDLGTRARMSDASVDEQTSAGLDRLAADQAARLQQLNTAYREKFGFPFLLAVKGNTTTQVLDALEDRLPRGREDEFAEALRQVYRIARVRLDDTITDAGREGPRRMNR
jgi:2-oxo-4-hydroxy-4-carboxy-5-ureidoimidazoline decarboxylase